jgi:hypothetical protein
MNCSLQETHLTDGNKRVEKDLQSSWCLPKQARVAILTLHKVKFKPKLVKTDKQVHFILTKGVTHQEE